MEEQRLFSATTVYFRAGEAQSGPARRTASVGPGLHCDNDIEEDTGSIEDSRFVQSPEGVDAPPSLRSAMSRRRVSMDYQHNLNLSRPPPQTALADIPTPPYSPPGTRPGSFRRTDSSQSVLTNTPSIGQRADSWRSGRSNTDQHGVYEVART